MHSQYRQRVDTSIPLPPVPPHAPTTPPESCIINPAASYPHRLSITSAALLRFHEANAWLNDDCIDFGAEVILRYLGTAAAHGDPVVFSCFVPPRHRRGGDEGLWRACKWSGEFWNKDIWIFPIHIDGNHWVLTIVYWRKRRIAYFDSLYNRAAFEVHVKVWNVNTSLVARDKTYLYL